MSTTQNNILMEVPARITSLGGGAEVQRLMPYSKKRMVGPFIFFDYLPRTSFPPGEGLEVRPHPHIGLSTLSYLLDGEILHHDSLGYRQVLRPGDVNWMTAGKGIAHSERMPEEFKKRQKDLSLLQFWVALPQDHEDTDPSFHHHPENTIPSWTEKNAEVRLIAGKAFGKQSPVQVFSPLFFMDVRLQSQQHFVFDPGTQECAFFVLSGSVKMNQETFGPGRFVILEKNSSLDLMGEDNCHLVVLGGEAFPEARHIYWNFVSSSKEKIEAAKIAWKEKTFPQVPGEKDFIPLPQE